MTAEKRFTSLNHLASMARTTQKPATSALSSASHQFWGTFFYLGSSRSWGGCLPLSLTCICVTLSRISALHVCSSAHILQHLHAALTEVCLFVLPGGSSALYHQPRAADWHRCSAFTWQKDTIKRFCVWTAPMTFCSPDPKVQQPLSPDAGLPLIHYCNMQLCNSKLKVAGSH